MQNGQTLLDLNNDQQQIDQISQSISSGVQFSSPADDPYGWAESMNIQQSSREYTTIQSNISFATGWQDATSSALNQLSDLISQAQQLAVSAVSSTGSSNGAELATEVNSILQQALTVANTQYNNQYIFSGTMTGTAAISFDSSTGTTTPNGNSGTAGEINVRTGTNSGSSGNLTTINLTSQDAFFYTSGGNTTDVFHEIWNLGQEITAGNTTGISNSETALQDAFDHINNESTIVGSSLSELSTQKSAISSIQTNTQSELSNLQDTDVTTATTQLTQAQAAYEAALDVTDKLDSLNLASILTGSTS